ncbi:MAG: hypothetical protein ACYDIC_12535 [Desulfobaccales bacterium]
MKRFLFHIFLIFIAIGVSSNISWCEVFNFRKTKWGMSIQQVKESEPLEIAHSSENILGYKVKVLDKDMYLVYIFVDNKLVRSRYLLAEEHSNKNDFIDDFKSFQNILIKKYGKPAKDDIYWRNNLYKKDPSNWGMAIGLGHLSYFSSWNTEDTEVICFLHGDNFNIKCGVEYISNKLRQLENKYKEKKGLENF